MGLMVVILSVMLLQNFNHLLHKTARLLNYSKEGRIYRISFQKFIIKNGDSSLCIKKCGKSFNLYYVIDFNKSINHFYFNIIIDYLADNFSLFIMVFQIKIRNL